MFNNLSEWLAWLERPELNSTGQGLENLKPAAEYFGVVQFPAIVITIAGTNGKGTSVAMLEAIYSAAGFKVASYTSPHLCCINERIRFEQKQITDDDLLSLFTKISQQIKEINLSYFEFMTLSALLYFKQCKPDVILLEVGLGGRLDATNVVDSDVAVITTIDYDHQKQLGNTREAIGYEKAGIFREGKPAVCGEINIPDSVIKQAKQMASPLYCLGRDFFYQKRYQSWNWHNQHKYYDQLPLPVLPLQNAATILQVVSLLQERLTVTTAAIKQGFKTAKLQGRMQLLDYEGMPLILDVAHNPQSASYLAEQLQQIPCKGRTIALVGMLADKDIKLTLKALTKIVDQWFCIPLNTDRSAQPEELVKAIESRSEAPVVVCDTCQLALATIKDTITEDDRVVVFGSFYTVGAVLDIPLAKVPCSSE